MLHGGADPLCDPAGSEVFFAGVTSAGVPVAEPTEKQSALRIYPDLRHEIFNEPEREGVFQDILDWLTQGIAPATSGPVKP